MPNPLNAGILATIVNESMHFAGARYSHADVLAITVNESMHPAGAQYPLCRRPRHHHKSKNCRFLSILPLISPTH